MWACGSDFQYQNADHWFHNLDKIIHYVNLNASLGGPVRAFYSTPSHYTDSVKASNDANVSPFSLFVCLFVYLFASPLAPLYMYIYTFNSGERSLLEYSPIQSSTPSRIGGELLYLCHFVC